MKSVFLFVLLPMSSLQLGEFCWPMQVCSNFHRVMRQSLNLMYRSGNYDCLDDEIPPDPIAVVLYDSKQTPLWRSQPKASEGTFSITGSGKFELCIQNGRMGENNMT